VKNGSVDAIGEQARARIEQEQQHRQEQKSWRRRKRLSSTKSSRFRTSRNSSGVGAIDSREGKVPGISRYNYS